MSWFKVIIRDKRSEDCNIIMLHNKCGKWREIENCDEQTDINTNYNNKTPNIK